MEFYRLNYKNNWLDGKKICLDPGHGATAETDNFRIGASGQREEWVNLRVSLLLRDLLIARGAEVLMTRTENVSVELINRASLAITNNTDMFVSVHHNATADTTVNFPIVYFHGNASENVASVELGRLLSKEIRDALYDEPMPVNLVSDMVIFPETGASVLRNTYGIPAVIGEASFFSNEEEDRRMKDRSYNLKEAKAYVEAINNFFAQPEFPILKKTSKVQSQSFEILKEASRMNTLALNWLDFYKKARRLLRERTVESLEEAYQLLTLSLQGFPDSPVARSAHKHRAEILTTLGRSKDADGEMKRIQEYFVEVT